MENTPPDASSADAEVRQAVEELREYLDDVVPPLLVADSLELLTRCPPQLTAEVMGSWAGYQHKANFSRVPLADFLYHAIGKIHLAGTLDLVPRGQLGPFLQGLAGELLRRCPPEEKEAFRQSLKQLGKQGSSPPRVTLPAAAGAAGAAEAGLSGARGEEQAPSEDLSRRIRRFSLLLQRLEGGLGGPPGATSGRVDPEMAAQLLTGAVENSRNDRDFRRYLGKLGEMGLEEDWTRNIFRTLSSALPGWGVAPEGEWEGARSSAATAMGRVVAMAENQDQALERFHQLVEAGVERFNAGDLARAAEIFEVASEHLGTSEMERDRTETLLDNAWQTLDRQRLRAAAAEPQHRPALTRVLDFFPALTPEGLWTQLDNEPDRQRRRLFLSMLLVHGAPARRIALDRLEESLAEGFQPNLWWLQRNFVYVLRLTDPSSEGTEERELLCLTEASQMRQAVQLVKEVALCLGEHRYPGGEDLLLARIREVEAGLAKQEGWIYHGEEAHQMLDSFVGALARYPSSKARRAVVAHGLNQDSHLGAAFSRLGALASQDLSQEPALVRRLLEALREQLPKKILGFVVRGQEDRALALVQALSGTPLPEVAETLRTIAEGKGEGPVEAAAARALAGLAPAPAPSPTAVTDLQGKIEVFGLPTLLQTLAQSESSGVLTLADSGGAVRARLTFHRGRLADSEAGGLSGDSAFYQVFQAPFPGTFAFAGGPAGEAPARRQDVLGLLMEAMRRADELRRARAVVANGVRLVPTGRRPTAPKSERDGALVRQVWERVRQKAIPEEIEKVAACDSYRVRTLLAHWLEEGALSAAAGAPGAGG